MLGFSRFHLTISFFDPELDATQPRYRQLDANVRLTHPFASLAISGSRKYLQIGKILSLSELCTKAYYLAA